MTEKNLFPDTSGDHEKTQTQESNLGKRISEWMCRHPFTKKIYIQYLIMKVGIKNTREVAPINKRFKERLSAAETEPERIAIVREKDAYYRNRLLESVLRLPRPDQEGLLVAFNNSAAVHQEQFISTGDERHRAIAISQRGNALALEKILFPENLHS